MRVWDQLGADDDDDDDDDDMNTCHPIPPLCKMISEICYSFPLVQYKYCLFADIDISSIMYPEDNRSGLFRFSTSDVAEQSIDVRPDLDAYDELLMQR